MLSAKFNCPVARQNCSLLATAHDCETGLYAISELPFASVSKRGLSSAKPFTWKLVLFTCK